MSTHPASKYTGWHPVRWIACATLVLLAITGPAGAATAGWSDVPLPGGRAALLPRVGLSPTLPRAVVLGELIEATHYRRDPHSAQLAAIAAHFAAPPAAGDEAIPIPVDPDFWRSVLGRQVPDRQIIGAILTDRDAALLCYGLLGLDPETLAYVVGTKELIRNLLAHAGTFASFASIVQVRHGALELPGGRGATASWEILLGAPLTDPARAIPALLDHDNGRLAYFAETAARLDASHLAMLLPDAGGSNDRFTQARAAYHAFVTIDELRNLSDLVFQRVAYDHAALLAVLPVAPNGDLVGSDAYWRLLLGDDALPADGPGAFSSDLEQSDPADPAWLLSQLSAGALNERRDLIDLVAFLDRFTTRFPTTTPEGRVYLGHAFKRYPALMLSLERLGLEDPGVWIAVVNAAQRLDAHLPGDAGGNTMLALFQAPIAMVDRARQVGTLTAGTATTLLAALATLDVTDRTFGSAVAQWLTTALLPAIGRGQSVVEGDAEVRLLDGLAGLTAPGEAARNRLVRWEDYTYRIDAAAAEAVRLSEVRMRQGGNTLDTALRLTDAAAALTSSPAQAAWDRARADLETAAAALVPADPQEDRLGPPTDSRKVLGDVASDLGRERRPSAKRGAALAARLSTAVNTTVADALTSIVYALWLGDPDGQAFLGGNVARRHDFARSSGTPLERARTRWSTPSETSGTGGPWHMAGSLLALDIGLGRLALRRTSLDLPDGRPMLNEGDRRAFIATLVLFPRAAIDDRGPARLMAWLADGRARLAGALNETALDGIAARLGLDSRRDEALRWTARHEPDLVPRLFLLSEILQLGRPEGEAPPAAWGPAEYPRTGCLCTALPDPPAPERYVGQPGTGVLVSRAYDLELTVIAQLTELGLPPALVRGVLASALQDFLDRAKPAYPDDWRTLAEGARDLARDRIIDYVSALTAGGALVPAAQGSPASDDSSHP